MASCYIAVWLAGSMTATEYVVEALGGPGVFKGRAIPTSPRCAHASSRASLSLARVGSRAAPMSVPEAANVLHMPPRTLARRRQARKLDPDQSDRLYRIARGAGRAVAAIGVEDKAATSLPRRNRAVNGEPPIRLLDTDVGDDNAGDFG